MAAVAGATVADLAWVAAGPEVEATAVVAAVGKAMKSGRKCTN
jgi:hypothetical protein